MLKWKHRLLPKPPEPPLGYMYFYRQLVRVTQVEQYAKLVMQGFDGYSQSMRDTLNYGVIERCEPVFEELVCKKAHWSALQTGSSVASLSMCHGGTVGSSSILTNHPSTSGANPFQQVT